MTSEYIAPLALKEILLNTLAGSEFIFMGIFFIAISILAGLFRIPETIFLLMIALSGLMLYNWFGGGLYLMILIIGGLAINWFISNIVKR